MPRLDRERWLVVSPYLDQALDLDPSEREAWLSSLRAVDALLAEEVRALLAEHDALVKDGYLAGGAGAAPPSGSLAGVRIGAYTLRSLIGQGGMGSVWLAERSDGRFSGLAAVKLLNASLVGRGGEARFAREGSLLARLRHPNIAHLIDAGMSSMGQPYLVLEHIDGEAIDLHCDRRGLGLEARLALFLEVLEAVAYAHANLVVHRDLKPANVLVDRQGRVKLLDFGIARLLEVEGGAPGPAPVTREGESVLTPEFAAPEQLTGAAITTATDIYTLGLLLFVLLTGRHPVAGSARSPAELIKAIVETPAPRASEAPPDAGIAARRSTTPARLRRSLQGDLDNIVARALRKDPRERYPSVAAMAEDLRRHMSDEPISARPDSLVYRAGKFVRRHRGGVAVAGLVLAAILGLTAGVAWQAHEAARQRDAARTELARAVANSEFTTFLLSVAAPAGRKFSVAELLEEGEKLIDKQFAGDAALLSEMLGTVGQQYMLAERMDRAREALERAVSVAAATGDPLLQARALCALAAAKSFAGDNAGAGATMAEGLRTLSDRPEHAYQRAECLIRRSEFGYFTGDGEAMIRDAEAALGLLDRDAAMATPRRIDAEGTRAYGLYLMRRNREADEAFARVMGALERVGRDRTMVAADTLNNWALVHYQGDIARAEPLLRRCVDLHRSIEGADSVAPTATFNYAGVLLRLGRLAEAEPLFEETIRSAAARDKRRIEVDARMELAELYVERGDLPRAAAQLADLTALLQGPRFGPFRRAQLAYHKGRLAEARGELPAARSAYAEALTLFDGLPQKIAMNVLALLGQARVASSSGDSEAAMAAAGRALALAESFVEPGAPSYLVGLSLLERGELLSRSGDREAARSSFAPALEHLRVTLGPDHPATRLAGARAGGTEPG